MDRHNASHSALPFLLVDRAGPFLLWRSLVMGMTTDGVAILPVALYQLKETISYPKQSDATAGLLHSIRQVVY